MVPPPALRPAPSKTTGPPPPTEEESTSSREPDENQQILDGTVFNDKNKNSVQDVNEPGLRGVTVSNGSDVTTTDSHGRYELPAFDNMTVFVTQPRGYQVPVDEDNVAQFFYHHLPEGSPELKYGGIAPTGALPDKVNFPLAQSKLTQSPEQHCVIGGDVQTYNQKEVEFARTGVFTDLAARTDYAGCGALFIGDVVGDDLSLYPQTRELTAMLNGPARFLPGNHDLDFDALDGEHEFDTFRSQVRPGVLLVRRRQGPRRRPEQHRISDEDPRDEEPPTRAPSASAARVAPQRTSRRCPGTRLIVLAGHIPLLEFADRATRDTRWSR